MSTLDFLMKKTILCSDVATWSKVLGRVNPILLIRSQPLPNGKVFANAFLLRPGITAKTYHRTDDDFRCKNVFSTVRICILIQKQEIGYACNFVNLTKLEILRTAFLA